jgi:hypothetical protein
VADTSPVAFPGDNDAGGRDTVSPTTDGAVAAAQARYGEHESDTFGQGSTIGDVMALPASDMNPAVGVLGNPPFEGPFFPETNQAAGAGNG